MPRTLKSRPAPVELEEYLTASEVAKLLKITLQGLQDLRSQGGGPPYFKLSTGRSGRVRYKKSAVAQWIESLQPATSSRQEVA